MSVLLSEASLVDREIKVEVTNHFFQLQMNFICYEEGL